MGDGLEMMGKGGDDRWRAGDESVDDGVRGG